MKKWLLNILRPFAVLLIISAFLAACTGGAEPAATTQATTEAETETKVKETVTSANEESSAEIDKDLYNPGKNLNRRDRYPRQSTGYKKKGKEL